MVLLKGFVAAACATTALAADIVVHSSGGNQTGKHGHPYGYGFLHEDINNSGDGGIYAELIQNRAFQFSKNYSVSTAHYFPINNAGLSIQFLDQPLSKQLPASMRVSVGNGTSGAGVIGFRNDGYWGMDVRPQTYTGSFWVKGAYDGVFTASLQSNLTDEVFASVEIPSESVADDWTEHTFELVPEKAAPNSNNTLAITFDGAAARALDFNLISLFPPTYKGRKNGLRIDLAEALADMNPHFLRFPGGNMLEGLRNDSWWDWKDSLGPLRYRPGFQGVWGYQQTHGLGLMEYLEWAEDMDLQIVLGVWAGLALDGGVTPQQDLDAYIEDALNEIEFVTGPANSTWGARRAELGHPEPFELNYVEVGNEDWLAGFPGGWDSYRIYRFPMFYNAIRKAYPHITVISSAASSDPGGTPPLHGPNKENGQILPFDALGDYHPYREPDELVYEFNRFDNDAGHIVGEVAATHVNGGIRWEGSLYPFPWWIGAVGEAVSLIGYERNSDRVPGTFYAPVLKNNNRFQWPITLLQFDADPKRTTKSVSWYCWSLFAHHPISHTLPTSSNTSYGPLYWGAGMDENRGGARVWKGAVFNTTNSVDVPVSVHFDGVAAGAKANLTLLTNSVGDPYMYNDPFTGVNIVNTTNVILTAGGDGVFRFAMPELSVAVLDTDVGAGNGTAKYRRRLS
ncbi:glycoside hydrolase family 51 protein [Bipolaris maydis ATCC 48331]|uniref:non-reducing end alpha-L-arabinofuranosidase n=2 Tax=Cochliobolus heterostrophus TaxID=5016 RepID=M2UXB1_COCH5|nr:glycoside hydrolase family 51 protein [Bipolaris maydis ATCC 48331]EMD92463.1 glycoside hydrolase family 51 protein [Bipolaris maydis C5]KAH7552890.1 glycoside hydrolase family 51 protein [Bipolaris maydis]ENI08157.1 glycoside hydrolase family 51 protein [Bipolaris maydis ATCC 48331]KAJ5022288.1 glycoside hydrolase [Bipolaris maydis]KAJ5060983.1 alpha-N-arabinofuranosidase A precursor [Bipolaris maydis]